MDIFDKTLIKEEIIRFIIPFKYSDSLDAFIKGGNDALKPLERVTKDNSPFEGNLFNYIRDEFKFSKEDSSNSSKFGFSWKKETDTPFLDFNIEYNEEFENNRECVNITSREYGLYLFKNSLGIFWMELKPNIKAPFTCSKLIDFLYVIRELTYPVNDSELYINNKRFYLGNWIRNELFNLGLKDFVFLDEIKSLSNSEKMVPNNPLLFTYIVFDQEDTILNHEEKRKLSYFITNGYSRKLNYHSRIDNSIKYAFKNVVWNATTEGSSFLIWYNGDNDEDYISPNNNTPGRIPLYFKNDYFTLYIKVLFQSLSLMIYSQRIHSDIKVFSPNNTKNKDHSQLIDALNDIDEEINVFLLKGMATSVSHLSKQNEYYNFLKSNLKIKEDINSVTSGISAISEIQQSKMDKDEGDRDRMLQLVLGIVSILAISSALTDTISFIDQIKSGSVTGIAVFISIIIGALGVFALVLTFVLAKTMFKIKKKK